MPAAATLSESSCSALVLRPGLGRGTSTPTPGAASALCWQLGDAPDPSLQGPRVRPRSQRKQAGILILHSTPTPSVGRQQERLLGASALASMTTTQTPLQSPVQHAIGRLTLPLQEALAALHCAAHARFSFAPSATSDDEPTCPPLPQSSHLQQQQQQPSSTSSSAMPRGKHRQKPQPSQGTHQATASAVVHSAFPGTQCLKDSDQQKQQGSKASTHSQQAQQLGSAPPSDPWCTLKLLVAGAMSAVVSRTCVAPLERVKVELVLKQGAGSAVATAAQVFRTEGVAGFWKGNVLNLLRTAPFKAVNFSCFDTLHKLLATLTGVDGNMERFTAGAMAGITATLVCFPLDVVRTRLMSKARGPFYGAGPFRTLLGILRNEGPAALYTGCLPAVIGMAPAGAVFYGVYDLLKHRHLAAQQQQQQQGSDGSGSGVGSSTAAGAHPTTLRLSAMYTLVYGALAGAASELIVYPLEVVRRRMQMHTMAHAAGAAARSLQAGAAAHGAGGAAAAAGGLLGIRPGLTGWALVVATCEAILKTEGIKGFYTGLSPNMLQVLPSAALSYYTYDTVKQVLEVAT